MRNARNWLVTAVVVILLLRLVVWAIMPLLPGLIAAFIIITIVGILAYRSFNF